MTSSPRETSFFVRSAHYLPDRLSGSHQETKTSDRLKPCVRGLGMAIHWTGHPGAAPPTHEFPCLATRSRVEVWTIGGDEPCNRYC